VHQGFDQSSSSCIVELPAPSSVLPFSNRFCNYIVETMASSDDDSAYSEEASNEDDEVNDENLDPNKNSLLTMMMMKRSRTLMNPLMQVKTMTAPMDSPVSIKLNHVPISIVF
jgi:hypothetical protein